MLWIVSFGVIGCVVGVLIAQKQNMDGSLVLFLGFIGSIIGVVLCCCYGSFVDLPETAYITSVLDSHKIATSDEGEIIYLDIQKDRGDVFVYYMSSDGRIRNLNYNEIEVEYADSDFCVITTQTKLTGWHRWLTLVDPQCKTTIYVPSDLRLYELARD